MPIPRFYSDTLLEPGMTVGLSANAATHACKVLRLQTDDALTLFNGDGHDYRCRLTSVKKGDAAVEILTKTAAQRESPLKIALAQAISSGERMDFTIQKAVELGATSIQPIASQRSVVKLAGERAEKRREHWQNVAIAACEQSGRAVVPEVAAPLAFADWLAILPDYQTRITLSPTAQQTLPDLTHVEGDICLLIGPEGGLTPEEIELATLHGFTPIQLGPRILRTETAAMTALAAIQTLWGDFR